MYILRRNFAQVFRFRLHLRICDTLLRPHGWYLVFATLPDAFLSIEMARLQKKPAALSLRSQPVRKGYSARHFSTRVPHEAHIERTRWKSLSKARLEGR